MHWGTSGNTGAPPRPQPAICPSRVKHGTLAPMGRPLSNHIPRPTGQRVLVDFFFKKTANGTQSQLCFSEDLENRHSDTAKLCCWYKRVVYGNGINTNYTIRVTKKITSYYKLQRMVKFSVFDKIWGKSMHWHCI